MGGSTPVTLEPLLKSVLNNPGSKQFIVVFHDEVSEGLWTLGIETALVKVLFIYCLEQLPLLG